MTSTILHCQTPITREMETPECRNTRQAKLLRERDEVNVPPESVITTSLVVSKSSEDPVVQWIDFRNARDTDILFRGRSVRLFERRSPGHLIFGGRLSRVRAVMALLTGEATIEEEVKKLSDPLLATIPLLCNTLLSGIEPTTAYRYTTKEAYSGFNTPRGFSDTEAFVKLASEKLLEFLLQSPRLCFGSQRQKLLSYRKTEIPVITTTDGCEPSPSNTKLPNKITLKLPPKIDRRSTLDSIPQKRKREQSDGNNNDLQLQNLTAVKKKTATSVATSSTQAITSSTSSQVTSTVGLQDLPSDVFGTFFCYRVHLLARNCFQSCGDVQTYTKVGRRERRFEQGKA
jgi:hypothetical protein